MNWRKIIKNQITDSKQGVLTSDSPLPKKKNSRRECKKEISRWFYNHINIKDKFNIYDEEPSIGRGIFPDNWNALPESTACKILDWFKEELDIIPVSGGRTRTMTLDGYICFVSVPAIYYHTYGGHKNKFFKIRAEIKTERWEKVMQIEIKVGLEKFYKHGNRSQTFEEWGRDNLDFRK
jgi:hypothetical protein